MLFYLATLILLLSCATITIKTVVGYNNFRFSVRIWIVFLIVLGWFSPLIISGLSGIYEIGTTWFNVISYFGYTLFGGMLIFLVLLICRDVVWYVIYGLSVLLRHNSWTLNPKNINVLNKANLWVLLCSVLISCYALYEGWRAPIVHELNIRTPLVKRNVRIVQLGDVHITRATPDARIQEIVRKVNSLSPDIVVLTGDIMDDVFIKIDKKVNILNELEAPYGVYSVLGSHEFYMGITSWSYKMRQLKFHMLFNRGILIEPLNVFISGVPDVNTAYSHPTFKMNFEQALKGGDKENYRILLSYNPSIADMLTSFNYNLILSGHTHGGQLFPIHYFMKKANCGYLAGDYKVNGIDMHVTRGAGTWGPMMRLFSPSEITLINLIPNK